MSIFDVCRKLARERKSRMCCNLRQKQVIRAIVLLKQCTDRYMDSHDAIRHKSRRTLAHSFHRFHLPFHLQFVTQDLCSQDLLCGLTAERHSSTCLEHRIFHLCACSVNRYVRWSLIMKSEQPNWRIDGSVVAGGDEAHRRMNTWWVRNLVCSCADQFVGNLLESSGAAVKRSRLEARNRILILVWTLRIPFTPLESRRDEEMPLENAKHINTCGKRVATPHERRRRNGDWMRIQTHDHWTRVRVQQIRSRRDRKRPPVQTLRTRQIKWTWTAFKGHLQMHIRWNLPVTRTCRRKRESQETCFTSVVRVKLKFDVNEEACPNADLAILSSQEGALIDGLPAQQSQGWRWTSDQADERSAAVLLDQRDGRSPRQIDLAHQLSTTNEGERSKIEMRAEGFRNDSERRRILTYSISIVSAWTFSAWCVVRPSSRNWRPCVCFHASGQFFWDVCQTSEMARAWRFDLETATVRWTACERRAVTLQNSWLV